MTIPEEVLDVMADAMLDPQLRAPPHNKVALPGGNVVRKMVINRAIAAAEAMGWTLVQKWSLLPEAQPDARCITTADGGCIAESCMHTDPPREAPE